MTGFLFLGFMLGIRHALEADHIATVATLACSQASRGQIVRQGIAWGVGHSLTLMLFGAIVLSVNGLVPERLAMGLEMAVGCLMILLGVDVIRRALKSRIHFHTHHHDDGEVHFHAHSHAENGRAKRHKELPHKHAHHKQIPLRALLLGLIHGMAGSAALVILVVDQIDSMWMGMLYIALFGVGSIAGMLLFTMVISIPLAISARTRGGLHSSLQLSIGGLTCCFGLYVLSS